MFTLYIKPENEVIRNLYEKHTNAVDGDSGIDLFFTSHQKITHNSISNKIDFKIQCKMTDINGNTVSYWLLPRSSIGKTAIRQCNSIGLIDSGYIGNLMAYVDNVGYSDYDVIIGERLFQITAPTLAPIKVVLVDDLGEKTDRGSAGFGSTGK